MPPVPTDSKGNKRKKPLSCGECRRLKLKCELVFPCAHCVKRGLASICPDGELVNGSRRTKILASTEDLHQRIAALEEALKAATSGRHPLLEEGLYVNRQEVQTRSVAGSSSDRAQTEAAVQPSTDALCSFSHLTIGDDPHVSRYYGAASSVYLSKRSIPSPSDARNTPAHAASSSAPNFNPSSDYTDLFPPFPYHTTRLELTDIITNHLPPPDIGRSLADTYFRTFGWFTNIVQLRTWDQQFFNHVYQDPNSPFIKPSVKPQRLAVVLLVYALGALMDLSKPPHNDQARHYFTGARACLSLDPSHSVTYVQCIYLYGSYIMNGGTDTSGGDTFWPLLRMGMAVCEAIGLHRDGSNWGLDEEQAMERRIVFWEIHGYDVLQSIALGRGACIADQNIDCRIPVHETDSGFHCRAYALTKIWCQINERQVRIRPWIYSEVTDIDRQLCDFQDELPYHLSPVVPPSPNDLTDPVLHKEAFQRNMLLLYINEARLTLHRGWFIRTLKESPIEPLSSPLKQSYLSCLEACRAIVSLVRNMVVLQGQLIHRRWHFFFHLFAACVCLAAAVIRAPSSSLARSVMMELEAGVALFKMTEREEFITVERLRENAIRAMQKSTQPASGPQPQEAESEDLDLLGARTTLKRSTTLITASTVQGMPELAPLNPPLFQAQAEAQGYASASGPSLPGSNMEQVQHIHQRQNQAEGQILSQAMSTIGDNNPSNLEWNDFDMDAFLQEIGVM
ncbi:hypothetical protein I317_04927 [Kwoniella heveanensis CBS 569]|nr:hypothetical protein I317_04927 [Kwoniella heveanensis CBS 569]